MDIGTDKLLWMYRKMMEIRVFEEKAIELFTSGQLPGFLHSQLGQEAVPVGTCANLTDDDCIISTHRGHGDIIAKGADIRRMMAELFAKEAGYCRGKGGSMHIADFSIGCLGAIGIVGGGLPVANGAALAAKLRGKRDVAVCFFGDGASNQGTFHEALNLAATWDLPTIFVCQNNLYGESTPQRVHQKITDISVRGVAYGMPGVTVDGNDVVAVYEAVREAVGRARAAQGPSLIECKTYRWMGHYIGDPGVYRPPEEVAEWKKKDPIARFKTRLLQSGVIAEKELKAIDDEVTSAIENAVTYARECPEPAVETALEDLWA